MKKILILLATGLLSLGTLGAQTQAEPSRVGSTVLIGKVAGARNEDNRHYTASSSATTLAPARPTRRSITIKNLDGAITVYIGKATVTAANGMELKAGESISLDWTGLIQVIAASGSPIIAVMETYD